MKITESKLREIIKSVFKESMYSRRSRYDSEPGQSRGYGHGWSHYDDEELADLEIDPESESDEEREKRMAKINHLKMKRSDASSEGEWSGRGRSHGYSRNWKSY